MKRDIYNTLIDWKNSDNRRPLLIRGARQTGKTYIVKKFGNTEFSELIYLNLERNPEYKEVFSSHNPEDILEMITLYTGKKAESGSTLLFIDEIQEYPEAIVSLRYFFEEMPDLHVIGAGSLLEFSLMSNNFRMPVGRIQYLFLYPMSFGEFLEAIGESELRNHILDVTKLEGITDHLHDKLNEYIRRYFIVGGMPAVVNEYSHTRDVLKCQRIQRSIIDTFVDDFAKYSKVIKHIYLKKIFNAVPGLVGKKFVYARVDPGIKSRELKEALELLETAGILTRVRQTSGAGIPLLTGVHESIFKIVFLDVGLFHAVSGVYSETAKEKDLTAIHKGSVAEQFAGQELMAYHSPYTRAELYYWGRLAKSSTAEIDYLIEQNAQVVPVEIKSGSKGRMKSMFMFLEKYGSQKAIKISQAPFENSIPIKSIPLYAMEYLIRKGL